MERSIAAESFLDGFALVRVETTVDIDRPPNEVFDYVTSPSLWHSWHPATASVTGVPNRPIVVGETVREAIRVGIKRFETTWTVVECESPRYWTIVTDSGEGVARIRYSVELRGKWTHFTRVLEFRSRYLPWRALDTWLMRWILSRNSRRALDQLKKVMEAAY